MSLEEDTYYMIPESAIKMGLLVYADAYVDSKYFTYKKMDIEEKSDEPIKFNVEEHLNKLKELYMYFQLSENDKANSNIKLDDYHPSALSFFKAHAEIDYNIEEILTPIKNKFLKKS
jgi:hypothetical protein